MPTGDDLTAQRPMEDAPNGDLVSARLQLVYPRDRQAVIDLDQRELVLGRRPEPGLRVDDPTVSRRHFAIRFLNGRHVGIDLGSRNGSRVDGVISDPRAPPVPLADQAVIRLGDVVFVYERGPSVAAPDAPEVSREAVFGSSAAAVALRSRIARCARDPSPVLLVGETGTGKEFIAREIHRLSRRSGPLVAVNCAALSPQLIESQLFGHAKGAFTGAHSAHEGFFRAAQGGTIFLDEIGELPTALQPKLLRVVQEGEVQPLGETRAVAVSARIVSATLRDLTEMLDDGSFRLDLYARLSPWEVRVPALAERRADILGWLERLHAQWNRQRAASGEGMPLVFEANAVERILLYPFRDNLRGLDRLVHRACGERSGRVDVGSRLPGASDAARPSARSGRAVRPPKPSKQELLAALERYEGSVRATAKHFGRERRQIYRWLEQYGVRAAAKS
jgi:transcriptional regulator with GAF, ATPase, and Fis domain